MATSTVDLKRHNLQTVRPVFKQASPLMKPRFPAQSTQGEDSNVDEVYMYVCIHTYTHLRLRSHIFTKPRSVPAAKNWPDTFRATKDPSPSPQDSTCFTVPCHNQVEHTYIHVYIATFINLHLCMPICRSCFTVPCPYQVDHPLVNYVRWAKVCTNYDIMSSSCTCVRILAVLFHYRATLTIFKATS